MQMESGFTPMSALGFLGIIVERFHRMEWGGFDIFDDRGAPWTWTDTSLLTFLTFDGRFQVPFWSR